MSARRDAMLARRDAALAPVMGSAACPAELRTPCVVWSWLTDEEALVVSRDGFNSPLVPRAWRRWLDARREYAARAGLSEAAACGPAGRPTLGDHRHRV